MRIRVAKLITVFVIILNIIAVCFIWKLLTVHNKPKVTQLPNKPEVEVGLVLHKKIPHHELNQRDITIIIRGFEYFENDIPDTVKSILTLYHNISILVISDTPLYPPINLNNSYSYKNVKFVYLKASLANSFKERTPLLQVEGKYVFIVPDSSRFNSKKIIEKLVNISHDNPNKILAIPYKNVKTTKCLKIQLDIREWFIRYDEYPKSSECDFIKGKHAIFIHSQLLFKWTEPFMLPFPDAFYIQAVARNVKVTLVGDLVLNNGKDLFKSHHNQWKIQQLDRERQKQMFHNLELKKVVRETGVVEWFGCRRDTPRCFGSIVDDTPQYLWEGKWTPPCCLAGLRRTARHVFEQLEAAHVRYWLEGGSLLGAMRGGDILPWDYDVDIGIYKEDITRCTWLLRARSKPVVDQQGFVWEKAIEGDFFRVQFSQVNRLHVDIFPFYSKNGTMTKDTWFKSHQQDREFPEYFLKPMSSIDFVGRTVSAPNNIHDFLEFKFGEGAIENPEYPNPQKMVSHGLNKSPVVV